MLVNIVINPTLFVMPIRFFTFISWMQKIIFKKIILIPKKSLYADKLDYLLT